MWTKRVRKKTDSTDWTKMCSDQEEMLLVSDSVPVRMDESFESIAHSIHLVVNY